jgi:simple sugar transport system permease protein
VIVTGGIDLSVGSVLALTGILCAKLLSEGYSPVLVVPVTVRFFVRIAVATHGALIFGFPAGVKQISPNFASFLSYAGDSLA